MADEFVTVRTENDPNSASMIKAMLEDAGYVVQTPGLEHRGMLGIAGGYVKIPIRVRSEDRDEVEALLAALDEPVVEDEDEDEDEDGRSDLGPDGESPRRRRIAGFVWLAPAFGAAHFYVRESTSGLMLLAAQVSGLVLVMSGHPNGGTLFLAAMATDLIGSMWNISRRRSGSYEAPSTAAQGVRTLVLLALATGALAFGARMLPTPDPLEADHPAARSEPDYPSPTGG